MPPDSVSAMGLGVVEEWPMSSGHQATPPRLAVPTLLLRLAPALEMCKPDSLPGALKPSSASSD